MTEQKSSSFKIFIGSFSITALVFMAASLFSYYQADKKYPMLLAFFMFIAFALTPVGIYTGFNFKTEEKRTKILNLIGLIGNFLIFIFTLGLMLFAALTKASN